MQAHKVTLKSGYRDRSFTKADLDDELSWIDVVGLSLLAGIGNMLMHYIPEVKGAADFRDALPKPGLDTPEAAAIQEVLEKHDILLIADEVVTGFGRLGSMFGSAHYGLRPDFITIAKGLTSAYAPLSGSIVSERVFEVLMRGSDETGPIGHGWTYSAHPIGAAAGVANLRLIDDLGLIENVCSVGPYFLGKLKDALADHPQVGEVRGEGLLAAVELVEDKAARHFFDPGRKVGPAIAAAMLKQGVICRAMPQGDILGFAPPLCLTAAEADAVVEATVKGVREVLQGYVARVG